MYLQRKNYIIRNANSNDAEILCNWWNDGTIMAHAGFPDGLGTTVDKICNELANDSDNTYRRLIIQIGNVPVGEMSYRIIDEKTAEIGIKICVTNYQGNGNGTKFIRMLIEYLFYDMKLDKIILNTNLNNKRAQHVYEKIGFMKTTTHIDSWKNQHGELQSSVDYELNKTDYHGSYHEIDGVGYYLDEDRDFSFLSKYGKVFYIFDGNDSGNISFGLENENNRFFVKVAGAKTINLNNTPSEAIKSLKSAIQVYTNLKHPFLIEMIEHYYVDDLYVAVFKWVDGECLHDHWNFVWRPRNHPDSPYSRFKSLSLDMHMKCFDTVCSFFEYTAKSGYAAIDFYDGSIMYDFENDKITICDIDYYVKSPYINKVGRMWGSPRFMSPEEFEMGAVIDEVTNVFTLGSIAFLFCGNEINKELCEWKASHKLYNVALKAVNADRNKRYQSISDFIVAWNNAKDLDV